MKCFINGQQRLNGRIPKLQYEAIAVGSVTTSKKTMKMLKKWADVIIDVRKWIPEDIYNGAFDNALQVECAKIWNDINPKSEVTKWKSVPFMKSATDGFMMIFV